MPKPASSPPDLPINPYIRAVSQRDMDTIKTHIISCNDHLIDIHRMVRDLQERVPATAELGQLYLLVEEAKKWLRR